MRVAAKFLSSKIVRCVRQSSLAPSSKSLSTLANAGDYINFPREVEGNVYNDNWSAAIDGVHSKGALFRNARTPVLTQRLAAKVESGKVALQKPKYDGPFVSLEAGDGLDHDDFTDIMSAQRKHLSSVIELFVEDAFVGTFASSRMGVRVVTDSPAAAMIVRNLLIQGPPRRTDHRARYNGWNFDERWATLKPVWNGEVYDMIEEETVSLPGERPVVVFHGGPGETVALQFVEREDVLVGANVVVGGDAPISALISALGQASNVMVNTMYPNSIAVSSLSITKGKDTTVVIGADDKVLDAAVERNVLYGAYDNILSPVGVAAMWSGVIGSGPKGGAVPTVVVEGKGAMSLEPDNLAPPATRIVFYEAGAQSKTLSEEEAIERLVDLSDESKKSIAAAIVKGVKLSLAGTAAEALKL